MDRVNFGCVPLFAQIESQRIIVPMWIKIYTAYRQKVTIYLFLISCNQVMMAIFSFSHLLEIEFVQKVGHTRNHPAGIPSKIGWRVQGVAGLSKVRNHDNGDTILGIAWDSITLRSIPDDYLEECEREGFGWSEYYLGIDDVVPAQSRDSQADVEDVIEEIEGRIGWLYIGDEGKRIQAVINSVKSEDEWEHIKGWSNHLQQKLEFPFEAIVDEFQERGIFQMGDKLKVTGIEMEDDHYGIIVQCRKGRKRYDFPLCDLAAVNEHSSNSQFIQDYRVWFANR